MDHTARVRALGMLVAGLLVLIALVSALGVSAQSLGQPGGADDRSISPDDRIVEGYRATLQALPPPPTPQPGYIGVFWPVISNSYLTATPLPSPTPPPFAGIQPAPGDERAGDRP